MIDKTLPANTANTDAPGERPRAEPADRHFLFNCHRIAMDFGIHAALRALEMSAPPPKNTA